MKNKESIEERLKRVDMHDYFIHRINSAMDSQNYIEASWLVYSCLENRYYRTLNKYRDNCKYCRSKSKCNKKNKNELALTTKIKCVQRLYENDVSCISNAFEQDIFKTTIDWVGKRNTLMHELLSLDFYENTDELFKENAEEGVIILERTYKFCTIFRKLFFNPDYTFKMPDDAAEQCPCKPKKDEEN